MNFIRNIIGRIIYGLSRFLDLILGLLIDILDAIVNLIKGFRTLLRGAGFIFLLILLVSPLGILILSPILIRFLFVLIFIPVVSEYLSKALIFLKYVLTEYLYDRSDYFIDGSEMRFQGIRGYIDEYIRKEEEKKRRAEEARRRAYEERQRRAEEEFRRFFGSGGFEGYQQTNGGFNSVNMGGGFKAEYEKSCDVLGVDYNANREDIRRAYRKRAKQYHPDLNKSENATEMFQKVNDANEFLNEENIRRYEKMN